MRAISAQAGVSRGACDVLQTHGDEPGYYVCVREDKFPSGSRTRYRSINSRLLYQLSYGSVANMGLEPMPTDLSIWALPLS